MSVECSLSLIFLHVVVLVMSVECSLSLIFLHVVLVMSVEWICVCLSVWMDERSLIALKRVGLIGVVRVCRQRWKHTVLLSLAEESFQDEAGSFSEN